MKLHILKFSRKQRLVRNFAVAAVCLLLTAWMWEFPALTPQRMLRRTERQYFLTGSELMYVGKDAGLSGGWTLYARNEEQFLVIQCSPTILGLRYGWSNLIPEEVYCTTRFYDPTEILMLSSDPDCTAAELQITLGETVLENGQEEVWMKEDYTARGEEIAPGMFLFRLQPHFVGQEDSLAAKIEREIFSGQRPGDVENIRVTLYNKENQVIGNNMPLLESDSSWAW